MNHELPVVLIKRKNIQTIFDYCLDNKIEFSVKDKPFTVEEFEVTLQITEIKKAIGFGIFAREAKLEIVGVTDQVQNQAKAAKRTAPAAPAPVAKQPEPEPMKLDMLDKTELEEEEEDTTEEVETKTENKPFSLDLSSAPTLSFS
ncbi:MAG: hypothetical protein F9K23_01115 [Bacteroidetes bacterium]|nr:MAG: hypothetical protein F9K23_01115 [Bacteroidota bacterium]